LQKVTGQAVEGDNFFDRERETARFWRGLETDIGRIKKAGAAGFRIDFSADDGRMRIMPRLCCTGLPRA